MQRFTLKSLFSGSTPARIAALVLSVSAVGCGSGMEPPPTDGEVAQGLVLKRDPVNGNLLTGTFREAERTLYIELLRGAETAEALRADPATPRYEFDLRIRDQDGQVFYVQQGGGELMDPTWEQEMAAPVDEEGRAADWALVEQLDAALAAGALALDAPEQQALRTTAEGIRALRAQGPSAQDLDVTPAEVRAMATTYRHSFRLYEGNILGGLGEHSSTRVRVYNNGTGALLSSRSNCNHGRCYSDSSMTYSCGRTILTTASALRPSQSCGTTYDWNSNAGHNCHDDSRLQNRSWYNNLT